jgi:hypothetical protein
MKKVNMELISCAPIVIIALIAIVNIKILNCTPPVIWLIIIAWYLSLIPLSIFATVSHRKYYESLVVYDGDMIYISSPDGEYGFNRNDVSLMQWSELKYTGISLDEDEPPEVTYAYRLKIHSPTGIITLTSPYTDRIGFKGTGLSHIYVFIAGDNPCTDSETHRKKGVYLFSDCDKLLSKSFVAKDFYCPQLTPKKPKSLGSGVLSVKFYDIRAVLQYDKICIIVCYDNLQKACVTTDKSGSRLTIVMKTAESYEFIVDEKKTGNAKINLDNAERIAEDLIRRTIPQKQAVSLTKNQ